MKATDWLKWTAATAAAAISATVSAFSLFPTKESVDLRIQRIEEAQKIDSNHMEKRLDSIDATTQEILRYLRDKQK